MRLLYLVVLLAGCATSNETYLSDGSKGYTIDCSGGYQTWGACIEKAGELCGSRGYAMFTAGESGYQTVATSSLAMSGSTSNRTMVVKCK